MASDIKVDQAAYIEAWRTMTMSIMDKCAMLEGVVATLQKQAEEKDAAVVERENRIASLVATVAAMSEPSQPPASVLAGDPLGR